jgi:hypothetical protein
MNTRIQQLMDRAGTDSSGKWMSVDQAEKFAELIVRQCAEIADTAEPFLASDLIREHFGVAE